MNSLNTLWIVESSGDNAGFRESGKYGGEAISWVGFGNDTFRSSFDSCHNRCTCQQNLYPRIPTVVAKLLQYSGSRVELRDEFSWYKMICSDSKW